MCWLKYTTIHFSNENNFLKKKIALSNWKINTWNLDLKIYVILQNKEEIWSFTKYFNFPESTGKKENNELCASKFFLQELLKSTSLVPDHRSGWRVAHRFCNSLGIMLASKSLTIGQELFPTYYYLWWEEIFWVFSKKVLIKKRLFSVCD